MLSTPDGYPMKPQNYLPALGMEQSSSGTELIEVNFTANNEICQDREIINDLNSVILFKLVP